MGCNPTGGEKSEGDVVIAIEGVEGTRELKMK